MEHELEMILKQEQTLFNPTMSMTYKEKAEYEQTVLSQEYYDVIETEDGPDAIALGMSPEDILEQEEEELIRLFGINFNQRHL